MNISWIQVEIYTTTEGVELLSSALLDVGVDSFSVVDSTDIKDLMEGKYGSWDYVDPELMELGEVETTVTVCIKNDSQGQNKLTVFREMLSRLKASDSDCKMGRLEYSTSNLSDEDWANTWKRGYKPVAIGETLLVCPTWEDCNPDGRIVLRMDPGMAFGTGTDTTTRFCLEVLERTELERCSTLDIGCGSGILAIAALLLGVGTALGIDIDETAVKVAKENAQINGVSDYADFICGNPADVVTETYDIVCANLSADIILTLMPYIPGFLKHGGLLILSGITENRKQDVIDVLLERGLAVVESKVENGWSCIVSRHHTNGR